ncbi:MAG TPA: hypothetical protein VG411_02515 [Actinomycetota bacterium]|nr:hypothetical protein [Actinomycetota bacterium]
MTATTAPRRLAIDEVLSCPGSTSRARATSILEGAASSTVTRLTANGPAGSVVAWWTTPGAR